MSTLTGSSKRYSRTASPNSVSRWFRTVTATLVVAAAVVFLLDALSAKTSNGSIAPRSPVYTTGSFGFTAPKELVRPLNMVEGDLDQSVEPEIKVDAFGNIYITGIHGVPGGVDLWKSTDKGANFVYLGEPDGAQDKCSAAGPVICTVGLGGGDDSIDVSPGGYLYVSSLWAGSVTMSTSYDGGVGGVAPGQKWEVNPAASNLPSDDRQWIAAYGPQTINMTYNATAVTDPPGSIGLFFVKSTDAGKTFSAPVAITTVGQTNPVNVEGNLVADQYNGNLYTAYIPTGSDNVVKVARSTDGGSTWGVITAYTGPAGTTTRGVFPILALDRGGNLHLAFTKSDANGHTNCHIFLTSSANPAAASPTWTSAVQVDNGPDNNTAALPWIAGGSPGVVDVTWYGSTTNSPDTPNSTWHVFFAQVTNALTTSPTISQSLVETNVVHDHSICFDGLGCANAGVPNGEPGNRDLAEYYTMTIDPDGNANFAYEDSVNGSCGTEMDPLGLIPICTSKPWFVKQSAGPSAYNPPAGPAPSTFAPNIPVGSPGGEPGMKADSHNCMFVTTPGNPWVWKSIDNGLSFLPPVNPVSDRVTSAGDEDILPIAQVSGARPDLLYFADLGGLVDINIAESTDGGTNWFAPGPAGAAGEMDASVDRQWLAYDRGVPAAGDLTVYEMDHEAAAEAIRFSALTNDGGPWSPPASGITAPEMILPPDSTFPNTNPGPVFVDPASHTVYGIFTASTIRTNESNPPFGKLPNVWEAFGAAPTTAGSAPGPFTDVPVFKGVQDSPSALPSPAPSPDPAAQTFGNNTANDFPTAAIDAAGNIYVAWAMNNSRTNEYMVWMATSHDHGHNFYGPFQVSHGPGAAVMPWIAAGDAGRVEVVYYATATPIDPNIADNSVQWNTMFAQSFNAADREPVFTISPVSHHVMHLGPICNQGILCGSGTRTLADFFQVSIGPDGLANIAYADNGPFPLPAGNPDTSQAGTHAEFARQTSGPLALANVTFPTCTVRINPVSAVSRKTHGASDFDIDLLPPAAGIECRAGQGANSNDHKVVITLPANVTAVGGAKVASGNGSVSSFNFSAGVATVNLTGVTNAQRLTIELTDVNNGTDLGIALVPMAVLLGDTTADGAVNSADISQTKSRSGQAVGSGNFRSDVTVDNALNSADISLVKSKSGTALPP
jgi:hypothetical protein